MPVPIVPASAPTRGRVVLPRSVLVVGAGLAGLRTAAELRAQGFAGHLTVVGAEDRAPYDRPPLSKELFTRTEPLWLTAEGYGDLGELADRVLLGRRARRLEADGPGARVTLAPAVPGAGTEETLEADVVVLAVGAAAARPASWDHALTLHGADDAERLRGRLVPGARLVVVGAGWIGAEVAGQAARHGCEVTVVEAAPTPLHRQVGAAAGALTVPWYAAAGVDLRCGRAVTAVRPDAVVLAGTAREPAEEVTADVVLAATGVRPATAWLAGAVPLTAHGALPVDAAGRVRGGPPSVRAVGDCAEMTTPDFGAVPGGHWDAALSHPAALAAGLLGRPAPPTPVPYVFSTQLGHDLTLVGQPPADDDVEVVVRGDVAAGFTVLYLRAGHRLAAGLTADRPRDVAALRRLLAAGSHPALDVGRASDPEVPLRRAVL
ncbi:NAD(P)/FAD-dependent oxidoreductase [Georgenia muralis]|uniref:NAD(P)/FAD-dependent oxidoreductase n=1 Tax=Georgenia muralis TaxID=154117 RepID=UPI001FE58BE4|nr:FAD-dependent oxidoreductase [Georgenia muralis]